LDEVATYHFTVLCKAAGSSNIIFPILAFFIVHEAGFIDLSAHIDLISLERQIDVISVAERHIPLFTFSFDDLGEVYGIASADLPELDSQIRVFQGCEVYGIELYDPFKFVIRL